MITHIRAKNFKSWADSDIVKLAPLTGFFGTNSSGKSSLLQMLLLLKQTVGKDKVLFFGDENSLANLGNFQEVIHEHEVSNKLYFGMSCKLSHVVPYPISILWQMLHFSFHTVIQEIEGNQVIEDFGYRSLSGPAKIVWENNNLSVNNQSSIPIQVQNCYGLSLSENSDVPEVLTRFTSVFEELLSHVYYLGPVRVHPKRSYHWEGDHPEDIGRWGDKTIDALLSARVNKLTIQREEKDIPIEDRISEWLREMNLAHSFLLERTGPRDGKDYDVRIQKREHGPKVTLADMGYGLSQFLPVLVLCYYVPKGSTLILEQPGIHLHPKVQSQLADLIIEVITERKLQILVESHSEHLLTRLQRRIAEEKISVDNTALYFCRNDAGVSNIENLKMDEFGNITNWPKNFFGNEMGDLFAMTKAQQKRQKKAEG